MEFERAIFRVYERCMEGLRDDDPETISPKSCRFVELTLLGFGVFLLFVLILLHFSFVGQAGCIPSLLTDELYRRNSSAHINLNNMMLNRDQILQINVDRKFSSMALQSSSISSNSNNKDDDDSQNQRRHLLRGKSDELEMSFDLKSFSNFNFNPKPTIFDTLILHGMSQNITDNNNNNNTTHSNATQSENKFKYKTYDYEFSYEISIIALPKEVRHSHHFETVNISMVGTECFGNSFIQSLIPLGGIDTIIRNNLMYSFQKSGVVVVSTGDYYTWTRKPFELYENFGEYISFKLVVLLASITSFALLSTITALLVRILISSGVVLLFPVFWALQLFGMSAINIRIISLSYPWIGVPIEMLRARNQAATPFVIAHLTRVVVYYVMYEAAQLAFSLWFYDERTPGQKELWLFAIMMLWEYYSMIYVRSKGSIILFPRVSLALYLIYHFYLFSQPSGFHSLALLTMFVNLVWIMIFCVRKYEIESFQRGIVNIDQPRAYYNTIPWPSWNVALAPDLTLFWPVFQESSSVYEMAAGGAPAPVLPPTVPPAPTDVDNEAIANTSSRNDSSMQPSLIGGSINSAYEGMHRWVTGNRASRSSTGDDTGGIMITSSLDNSDHSRHSSDNLLADNNSNEASSFEDHSHSHTHASSLTEERLRARRVSGNLSQSNSSSGNSNASGNGTSPMSHRSNRNAQDN